MLKQFLLMTAELELCCAIRQVNGYR